MPRQPGVVRYVVDPREVGLRQPAALAAFGGWVDAASAGTGAVRYLVSTLGARKLAEIEPEEFYSFTDTRPLTSVVAPGERAVQWPQGELFAAARPEAAGGDLLLFVAPEPNLKWRAFASATLDVMQQAGARSLVSLGSIFGPVHHRARVPLTGWATDPGLREVLLRYQIPFTNYEGPTGFVTVLLAEARARGLPAAAVLAFTPNYIQGVPNPRASHALLQATANVLGVALPLDELERTGRALVRQVDRLLTQQPGLREQVERVLGLSGGAETAGHNEEPQQPAAAEAGGEPTIELPSPQAVVSELEEFLRQLREKDQRGPDSSPAE